MFVKEASAYDVLFKHPHETPAWPARGPNSRLGRDCVPTINPKLKFSKNESFYAIGSCFARNIERHLSGSGVRVLSSEIEFPVEEMFPWSLKNDLLVKYTPGSIKQELDSALGETPALEDEQLLIELKADKFFDISLPMWYPPVSKMRALTRRKEIRNNFSEIAKCDVVILTLGLIEHWFDRTLGIYINDVPNPRIVKNNPERFGFRIPSFDENKHVLEATLDLVKSVNSGVQIIITTSPVPMNRSFSGQDVIVANTYSKSMLRTIAQDIADARSYVDYFPSYEMVMLSDPNVSWVDDLRHVRDHKVAAIMVHFCKNYFKDYAINTDSAAKFAAAERFQNQSEWAQAFDIFIEIYDTYKDDDVYLHKAAICAENTKNYDKAYELAARYCALRQEPNWILFVMARSALHLGRAEEAITLFERFLGEPTFKMWALAWLMRVTHSLGKKSQAVGYARLVIAELEGGLPREHYNAWAVRSAFRTLRNAKSQVDHQH